MNTQFKDLGPLGASEDDRRAGDRFSEESAAALSFQQNLRVLWLGKWVIAAVVVLVAGLTTVRVYSLTPTYTAVAQVVLETHEDRIVDIESVVSGLSSDYPAVNTEAMVLRSRELFGRVVDELDLTADPEFNPSLTNEVSTLKWVVHGVVSILPGPLIDVLPEALTGVKPDQEIAVPRSRAQIREAVIDRLDRAVRIAHVDVTYVFEIFAETTAPVKSARIANSLAEQYVLAQLQGKYDATREATEWLSERVADLKSDLERSERDIEEFLSSTPLVSEEALAASSKQLKDLRERRRARLERREELQAKISEAGAMVLLGDYDGVAQHVGNRRLIRLAEPISEATEFEARESAILAFNQQLDDIVAQYQTEIARIDEQNRLLDTSIDEAEGRIDERSADLVALRQLQREAEANKIIYEHFLTRTKETAVQQGIQQADSRVLTHAVPPRVPTSPRKARSIAIAIVLGGFLGAGVVLLREYLRRTIRAPEDLEQLTGLPVLGTIPEAGHRNPLRYTMQRPTSNLSEAMRNLRTSLLLSHLDRAPQVIMLTSSVSDEGKTTTILMLSRLSVALGKRVLVVECDIRRPTFSERFQQELPGGLLSVLSGERDLEEVIWRDEETGLELISGQRSKANAADIFSSDRFAAFIARLRESYDFILIDTPPVLAVPDARIVGRISDAILYAVRWNHASQDQVRAGLKLFAQINVPITGLVLTRTNPKLMARYGYAGYGYGDSGKYYVN